MKILEHIKVVFRVSCLLSFVFFTACSFDVRETSKSPAALSRDLFSSTHSLGPNKALIAQKRQIYFKPTSSWRSPHLWFWFADKSPNGLGDWPGRAVLSPVENTPGWFVYSDESTKPWAGFIFNDGKSSNYKTNDITSTGSGCYILSSDSGVAMSGRWYELNTDECPFNLGGGSSPFQVAANRASGSFASETLLISLDISAPSAERIQGKYTLDGTDPQSSGSAVGFSKGTKFLAGEGVSPGKTITLKLHARDSQGREAQASYTYSKIRRSYTERDNQTILQGFYWYIRNPNNEINPYFEQPEPESNLWEYYAKEKAEQIYDDGFSHVWLPPTGKAFITSEEADRGEYNVGYAIYDHYDLGEFYQSSHIRTKYGTKSQLQAAVSALQQRKIKVVADIVLNHMLGTDNMSEIPVDFGYVTDNYFIEKNDPWTHARDRNYNVAKRRIDGGTVKAYLDFDFANELDILNGGEIGPRRNRYSSFKWRPEHFSGMEIYGVYYLFKGKQLGNVNIFPDMPPGSPYDYRSLRSDVILGSDIDLKHPETREELKKWTRWLVDEVGFDGFRVDAIRHMDMGFVKDWAASSRKHMDSVGKRDRMLMFGENWDGWSERLYAFLIGKGTSPEYNPQNPGGYAGIDNSMMLFDVPLHYDFQKVAGDNIEFKDISTLPDSGLLAKAPYSAVTFVDNHDTVPTQKLASYIPLHTKLQAYTFILLNTRGIPCVYYRDMYKGSALPVESRDPYTNTDGPYLERSMRSLVKLRNDYVYGDMTYFRGTQILGAKFGGRRSNGGLVYLIRNNGGPSDTLDIPTDGARWKLAAGQGDPHRFKLTGNWAVWIREDQPLP